MNSKATLSHPGRVFYNAETGEFPSLASAYTEDFRTKTNITNRFYLLIDRVDLRNGVIVSKTPLFFEIKRVESEGIWVTKRDDHLGVWTHIETEKDEKDLMELPGLLTDLQKSLEEVIELKWSEYAEKTDYFLTHEARKIKERFLDQFDFEAFEDAAE